MAIEPRKNDAGWFVVADEDHTRRLGDPRGTVFTAAEMKRMVQIEVPDTVREIHEWKFNGPAREYQCVERDRT
jgi:hypothetical protein